MCALLKARGRRVDREAENEYGRLRILVGALGVKLPPYRRHQPKAMTADEVNRQLAVMQRRGIAVSYR